MYTTRDRQPPSTTPADEKAGRRSRARESGAAQVLDSGDVVRGSAFMTKSSKGVCIQIPTTTDHTKVTGMKIFQPRRIDLVIARTRERGSNPSKHGDHAEGFDTPTKSKPGTQASHSDCQRVATSHPRTTPPPMVVHQNHVGVFTQKEQGK
jgi:hypothetical protein